MGLISDLGADRIVAVDTSIFIYLIEAHPGFVPLIRPLFQEVRDGRRELITSELSLLEVLVVLFRAGNHVLADQFEKLLTQSRGIQMVQISRDALRSAARLRAVTAIKTPDALHLVAALESGCKTFLTNDRDLPVIPGLRILQLSSYLSSP